MRKILAALAIAAALGVVIFVETRDKPAGHSGPRTSPAEVAPLVARQKAAAEATAVAQRAEDERRAAIAACVQRAYDAQNLREGDLVMNHGAVQEVARRIAQSEFSNNARACETDPAELEPRRIVLGADGIYRNAAVSK